MGDQNILVASLQLSTYKHGSDTTTEDIITVISYTTYPKYNTIEIKAHYY